MLKQERIKTNPEIRKHKERTDLAKDNEISCENI